MLLMRLCGVVPWLACLATNLRTWIQISPRVVSAHLSCSPYFSGTGWCMGTYRETCGTGRYTDNPDVTLAQRRGNGLLTTNWLMGSK